MKLPKNLLSGAFMKPQVILCETDKTKICDLNTQNFNGSFKFNSYSEISFEIARECTDSITGETYVHPFYDKIEALRLLYIPGFGYFEIQDPEINSDGIKETKNINAFSLEYSLSQKYLDDFVINTPDNEMNIGGGTPSLDEVDPVVQFYNPADEAHSLLHLVLKKAYGWSIGHVDLSLKTQTRSFEIDRSSIYDFLVNDIVESFKCYFVFDTINNVVNVYADTITSKFYGDGETKIFILPQIFSSLGAVTINGYKTLEYSYDNETGTIEFIDAPEALSIIEIEDGALSMWDTDVFVSFNNLAEKMKINYSADDIKTVLKVTGADEMDIRDVNMGLDYIMDLSYFHTVDWMGQELYDAYKNYLKLMNEQTPIYTSYLTSVNDLYDKYFELQNRTSTDLTTLKLNHFKTMLQFYYKDRGTDRDFAEEKIMSSTVEKTIKEDFAFLTKYVDEFNNPIDIDNYLSILKNRSYTLEIIEEQTYKILNIILQEYGSSLLKARIDAYTTVQETNIDAGWSTIGNDNYYMHWANYMMLTSCQKAFDEREEDIKELQKDIDIINAHMKEIADLVAMENENNFTKQQLTRLSAFMREDEYSDSNFLLTGNENNSEVTKAKKELLQCGKIELDNICKPRLSFTATMANIFALPEFEPIVNQFQLGNMIRISMRPDYIKKSRIMQVDINFDDFSDFSVTFGDLISSISQADIHADLLKQAASAGKSVASNSTYWDKGADMATRTDTKLQQGLLDATQKIKATDGTQGIEIDKYGIHLKKVDPNTGEVDPKQAWMINNLLCYTDDNWKTTRAALGEFTVDDKTFYGLLAEAVIAGYIEGSKIVGGTIKIGEREDGTYNFEVDEEGTVTFRGGKGAANQISELDQKVKDANQQLENIQSQKMYRVEISSVDRNIMTRKYQTATLTCKVYSWDEDITDTLDANIFNWIRVSSDHEQDVIWNSMAIHQGIKTLTISTEDIMNNASFSCQVNLPD